MLIQGYTSDDCSHFLLPNVKPILAPYLYMAANNSVCDRHIFHCHTINIIGQDFLDSSDLACGITELKQDKTAEKSKFPAKYISSTEMQCIMDKHSVHLSNGPRTYELRVTNDGNEYSNEIFLTIVDTSCHACPAARMPQHPTTCAPKPGTCQTKHGCKMEGDTHPRKPCMICKNSNWMSSVKPVFTERFVDVQLYKGETLRHKLDVEDSSVNLVLGLHPKEAFLDGLTLVWNTNNEEVEILFSLNKLYSSSSNFLL